MVNKGPRNCTYTAHVKFLSQACNSLLPCVHGELVELRFLPEDGAVVLQGQLAFQGAGLLITVGLRQVTL